MKFLQLFYTSSPCSTSRNLSYKGFPWNKNLELYIEILLFIQRLVVISLSHISHILQSRAMKKQNEVREKLLSFMVCIEMLKCDMSIISIISPLWTSERLREVLQGWREIFQYHNIKTFKNLNNLILLLPQKSNI